MESGGVLYIVYENEKYPTNRTTRGTGPWWTTDGYVVKAIRR